MNDDTPFLGAELASAYLDNEATFDERARVEASADLQGLVADLVGLRARLNDVAPVTNATRESAFAVAMAEFGVTDVPVGAASVVASPVVASPVVASPVVASPVVAPVVSLAARRQKVYRIITGVAAASVLTVGGFAALNSVGGSDEKSSQGAVEPANSSAAAKLESAAPADTDAAPASGGNAPAETAAPADSAAANDQISTEAASSADSLAALPVIANPDELAAYADVASANSMPVDRVRISAASADACPASTTQFEGTAAEPLGTVSYAGEPALVVRRADGSVQAISLLSCAVLTQIPPP